MLSFLLVMSTALMSDSRRVIQLRLSSPDYLFRSGQSVIFRSDAFQETVNGPHPLLSSMEIGSLEANEKPLLDNVIRGVNVSGPGKFRGLLINLEIVRPRDRKRFHINQFVLPEFSLLESDFEKGTAVISVSSRGIFKITALDKDHRPISKKKVAFANTTVSSQILTDDNGEFIFLGNPTEYHFELTPESSQSFGLLIMPL